MDLESKEGQAKAATAIAELRREKRYRQRECAEALGVAQPTYAEMEYGKGRIRRRDLVTLAVLYGMAPEEAFPSFFDADREGAAA